MIFKLRKRIYIANTSGLGNRLETLVLGAMIEDYFGHAIYLDWPESDSLRIAGTREGSIAPWERLQSRKVRDFDAVTLESLGDSRVINLRATYGPRHLQQRYVLPTAARLRPHPRIGRTIREAFVPYGDRPAVAVHIRHGDFSVAEDLYDANATRHPAPALWWYEYVMSEYARQYPDVYFVLGFSGDGHVLQHLGSRFDIVSLPGVFNYSPLLQGHLSPGHPVVDLFGLACCTTMIAAPTSSFSHWATNLLGPPTRFILPPPRMERSNPSLCTGTLRGCILLDWREAAESGRGTVPVAAAEIPQPLKPVTDWL